MQELSLITNRLDDAGIPYCLVGGFAAIAYGRPRLTLDVDLVIALPVEKINELIRAFPLADFYLPPREILLAEATRETRGHFNIIHHYSALRADCYLVGKSIFSQWEITARTRIETPFGAFWFSPVEAIIVHKLLFYREGRSEKHMEDIRAILSSTLAFNTSDLLGWIEHFHLQPEWNLVKIAK